MDAIALAGYLGDLNVRAFLAAICLGEGTKGPDGYRTMFTGKLFDDFSDHPRQVNYANGLHSTAAGKYQLLSKTWDGLVKKYGFTDFEPRTQDIACIALIHGRGALDDVVSGRIEQAVAKCNKEWASLPGSPYGQPVVTMAQFLSEYQTNGGTFAPVVDRELDTNQFVERETTIDAPLFQLGPEPNTQGELQEKPMAPFIAAALPALIELVPKLGTLFSSGSATANRNVKAAEIVVEAATRAIGASNAQDMAERIKNDPQAAVEAKKAIEAAWFQIQEVGGGIEAASKRNEEYLDPNKRPFWQAPVFSVSILLMLFPAALFFDVLWLNADKYNENLRTQIVTAVLGLLSVVSAFWLGSSLGSQRKTQ